MFGYYLDLAWRSLRRNKVLTALMVLALGLGIGASITTLTVLKVLSGDPLPQKSGRVFTAQIDPLPAKGYSPDETKPLYNGLMPYTDAMNLLHAHKGQHQAAMALTQAKVSPKRPGARPFFSEGVMTTADFFDMFDVPFQYGGGWSVNDGDNRARVVVIGAPLNDKLFDGKDSVGKIVRVNEHDYRVVGVLKYWKPEPHFYAINLGSRGYGIGDAVFVPLQSALADGMGPNGLACWADHHNKSDLETASCAFLTFWVELKHASGAAAYKAYLSRYVAQQISLGRLHRPKVWLFNLMTFLKRQHVVPSDVHMQTNLAFGFLLICIVNTVGLLLAKCLRRSREIGVRRALGATRKAIFAQFMVESGMVGLAGGVLGLAFAELGLLAIRHQPTAYASLAHLDVRMFVATFLVALVASLIAGLLPAWRACAIAPAPQLKSV